MNNKAFSLMEIVVVVVLVSIVAGFGIPSYQAAMQKAREREVVANSDIIRAAGLMYKSQVGAVLQGNNEDIDYINEELGLNILETNNIRYNYTRSRDGLRFLIDGHVLNGNGNPVCTIRTFDGGSRCKSGICRTNSPNTSSRFWAVRPSLIVAGDSRSASAIFEVPVMLMGGQFREAPRRVKQNVIRLPLPGSRGIG